MRSEMVDSQDDDDDEVEIPTHATPAEEAAFWRKRAALLERRWRHAAEELEEFSTSSRELEAELEAQLEQAEGRARELSGLNQRMERENEILRSKLDSLQAETNKEIASLADDLKSVSKAREDLTSYVREMEQKNDDLERSKRHMISSLEDFEQRLNAALERNAFLESELEERDQLQATIQRLKDESRDLRLEMSVKESQGFSTTSDGSGGGAVSAAGRRIPHTTSTPNILHDNELSVDADETLVGENASTADGLQSLSLAPADPRRSRPRRPPENPRPKELNLTPNSRMVAVSLVGDLLQKVNALESRLATYRNHVRDAQPLVVVPQVSPASLPRRESSTPSPEKNRARLVKTC